MKKITFVFIAVLAALVFIGCPASADPDPDPVVYAIGDTGPSGVGIVFYTPDGGLHGLEAAPVDQSDGATWSDVSDGLSGAGQPLIL